MTGKRKERCLSPVLMKMILCNGRQAGVWCEKSQSAVWVEENRGMRGGVWVFISSRAETSSKKEKRGNLLETECA